jgi:membrane protease YdiL (CAAX protease family)
MPGSIRWLARLAGPHRTHLFCRGDGATSFTPQQPDPADQHDPGARTAAADPYKPVGTCPYCGAPLFAHFYFCLRCATPFQHPESVITPLPRPYLSGEEKIRIKAPNVWPLFWSYVAVVVGSGILALQLFGMDERGLAILVQEAALVAVTSVFAVLHWRALKAQLLRLAGLFQPATLLGLVLLVPCLALNYGYHQLLVSLGAESPSLEELFGDFARNPVAIILIVCVSPAILEEVAFRGLLQHWLQIALRPINALVLASALFAALHFSLLSAPYLFLVGMLLGWVKWKTGSLYPPMLLHFLHNLLVVQFLWAPGS